MVGCRQLFEGCALISGEIALLVVKAVLCVSRDESGCLELQGHKQVSSISHSEQEGGVESSCAYRTSRTLSSQRPNMVWKEGRD